jgi:hypothetical protein
LAANTPANCELKEVPLTDEFGETVTQEVLVCSPDDIPQLQEELGLTDLLVPEPVPEFKEVVVCSTLTGTCEMVKVAGDHEVLEGCDLATVPVTTANGVKMEEAIIVDTPEEAAHYGFSTADPSKATKEEDAEKAAPETADTETKSETSQESTASEEKAPETATPETAPEPAPETTKPEKASDTTADKSTEKAPETAAETSDAAGTDASDTEAKPSE